MADSRELREQRDTMRAVRDAYADAMEITEPAPAPVSWFANNFTHKKKTLEERLADTRRKFVLERLREAADDYNQNVRVQYMPQPIQENVRDYNPRVDNPRLESAYRHHGFFHSENPIAQALLWSAQLPASAVNNAEDLAYRIDPLGNPDKAAAQERALRNVNSLLGGLPEDLGILPEGTGSTTHDYRKAQEYRENFANPVLGLDSEAIDEVAQQARFDSMAESTPGYEEMLERSGVPRSVAIPWGMVGETILDPFNMALPAGQAARAGRTGEALSLLFSDYIPQAALYAPIAAGEVVGALSDIPEQRTMTPEEKRKTAAYLQLRYSK